LDAAERKALGYVAANVRQRRLAAKLTQQRLAEAIGVEPRFVQAIEAATQAPSFKTLVSLATALGVEAYQLLAPASPAKRRTGRPRKSGG
jgi:transcriptional regulator with XRE-family HTH domain